MQKVKLEGDECGIAIESGAKEKKNFLRQGGFCPGKKGRGF